MKHFGTFEAKNRLSALLDMVEAGEEVTITRNGKAVAKLVPADGAARDIEVPEMAVGIYDRALVVDHLEQRAWFVHRGLPAVAVAEALALIAVPRTLKSSSDLSRMRDLVSVMQDSLE